MHPPMMALGIDVGMTLGTEGRAPSPRHWLAGTITASNTFILGTEGQRPRVHCTNPPPWNIHAGVGAGTETDAAGRSPMQSSL